MNWANVDLNSSYERSQNILDGYSFDTLLLEISTNLTTMDKPTITALFEKQIREKMRIAREVFNNNIENIVENALEWQNMDDEPNKPTTEEWNAVMSSLKDNMSQPQEITVKGEYYIDYFIEVLPPIMWSKDYVLSSEPYSHTNAGKATYIGFFKKNDKFFGVIATKDLFTTLLKL